MAEMFSSTACAIAWARSLLGVHVGTYVPADAQDMAEFVIVERAGGPLDYPHDSPDITFQIWAKSEAVAESEANVIAIALKTQPMDDPRVNAVGVPDVMTYGKQEGGWFVWQVGVRLEVNIRI